MSGWGQEEVCETTREAGDADRHHRQQIRRREGKAGRGDSERGRLGAWAGGGGEVAQGARLVAMEWAALRRVIHRGRMRGGSWASRGDEDECAGDGCGGTRQTEDATGGSLGLSLAPMGSA